MLTAAGDPGLQTLTPEVYAIELVEFPKDIPIAKVSAEAASKVSSALILLVVCRQTLFALKMRAFIGAATERMFVS